MGNFAVGEKIGDIAAEVFSQPDCDGFVYPVRIVGIFDSANCCHAESGLIDEFGDRNTTSESVLSNWMHSAHLPFDCE